MLHTLADAVLLLAMTLGGGLAAIISWTETIAIRPLWRDVLMFAVAGVIFGLVNLPFSWWHTFRIEESFRFNRMTPSLRLPDPAPRRTAVRGAVRVQPDAAVPMARRPGQGGGAAGGMGRAAARADPVADERRRYAVVA